MLYLYDVCRLIWCRHQILTRLRKLKIQDEIFSLEKKNNDNKTGKFHSIAKQCTPKCTPA